jgi:hypothetical protein
MTAFTGGPDFNRSTRAITPSVYANDYTPLIVTDKINHMKYGSLHIHLTSLACILLQDGIGAMISKISNTPKIVVANKNKKTNYISQLPQLAKASPAFISTQQHHQPV